MCVCTVISIRLHGHINLIARSHQFGCTVISMHTVCVFARSYQFDCTVISMHTVCVFARSYQLHCTVISMHTVCVSARSYQFDCTVISMHTLCVSARSYQFDCTVISMHTLCLSARSYQFDCTVISMHTLCLFARSYQFDCTVISMHTVCLSAQLWPDAGYFYHYMPAQCISQSFCTGLEPFLDEPVSMPLERGCGSSALLWPSWHCFGPCCNAHTSICRLSLLLSWRARRVTKGAPPACVLSLMHYFPYPGLIFLTQALLSLHAPYFPYIGLPFPHALLSLHRPFLKVRIPPLLPSPPFFHPSRIYRVGHNRIYPPYMAVYSVIPLPKIP